MADGSGHPFTFWSKRWERITRPPLSSSGGNAQIIEGFVSLQPTQKSNLFADTKLTEDIAQQVVCSNLTCDFA